MKRYFALFCVAAGIAVAILAVPFAGDMVNALLAEETRIDVAPVDPRELRASRHTEREAEPIAQAGTTPPADPVFESAFDDGQTIAVPDLPSDFSEAPADAEGPTREHAAADVTEDKDKQVLRDRIELLEKRVEELTRRANAASEVATTPSPPAAAEQLPADLPELKTAKGRMQMLAPIFRVAGDEELATIDDYLDSLMAARGAQRNLDQWQQEWNKRAVRFDSGEARQELQGERQDLQEDVREAQEALEEEAQNSAGDSVP